MLNLSKYEKCHSSHQHCLICGVSNPHSLKLSFLLQNDNSVTATFIAADHLQGYSKFLHGGIISSLLDSAMLHCLFFQGIQAVTGELNVRFLHPISLGSELELKAECISSRQDIYKMQATIKIDGKLYAKGNAKFVKVSNDIFDL